MQPKRWHLVLPALLVAATCGCHHSWCGRRCWTCPPATPTFAPPYLGPQTSYEHPLPEPTPAPPAPPHVEP